jgi:hypothetical protein
VCLQTHAAGAFGPGPSGKSLMDGTNARGPIRWETGISHAT